MVTDTIAAINEHRDELIDEVAELIVGTLEKIEETLNDPVLRGRIKEAAKGIGKAILSAITLGLSDKVSWDGLNNALGTIKNATIGGLERRFGINSPAKEVVPIGHAIAEGLALGISNAIGVAVAAAVKMANAVLAVGDKAASQAFGRASRSRMGAFRSTERADASARSAEAAQDRADKESEKLDKLTKRRDKVKDKKKKAQLTKQIKAQRKVVNRSNAQAKKQADYAEKQQNIADRKQTKYEEAQREAEFKRELALADNLGKAELYDEEVTRVAELSQAKLAEAQAKEAEAKRLGKKDNALREQLLKESRRAAREAMDLADKAHTAQQEAMRYYEKAREEAAKAIKDRIADLLERKRADEQARVDEEEYAAADNAGKAAIMESRARKNDERAEAATAAFEAAIKRAEELARTDAEAADAQLEIAAAQYEIAKAAIDEAKSQRDEAANLLGGVADSAVGGVGQTSLNVSASVLAEAAKSVDRYTKSLSDAQALALAGQGTSVNYNQYNYSPEALNNATIYRQSKNLLSAAIV